ncbi:adenylate/guanylate cyclase domain-containing protein [Thalassospiraceae bacterium LMO-JJ14]|nr:adenylate/guanylate cyclase domain-containing protein [Thalassospiraceae bacterium LMO-JJ14]
MPGITQFEVQVQQGQRWSIHAQFGSFQKEAAVEEARGLERMPGISAVKVVREVYDPDRGTSQEFVIYKSAGVSTLDPHETDATDTSKSKSGWARAEDEDADDEELSNTFSSLTDDDAHKRRKKSKGKPKESTLTLVVVKLLMVALISLTIAGFFTFMASSLISGKVLFGTTMKGNAESNVLFVVFVGTFLLSALMMASSLLKKTQIKDNKPLFKPKAAAAPPRKVKKVKKKRRKKAPAPGRDLEGADSSGGSGDDAASNERLRGEMGGEKEGDGGGSTPPGADAKGTPGLSPKEEKQKAFMMKALGAALEGSNFNKEKLDNFNKFGVNLWVAGATEALMQSRGIDQKAANKILGDSVQVLGYKKSHAENFAGKYEEYLLQDSRYMQMFQAGRNAMNTFMTDETHIARHMDSALEEWNKPKQKEEQPRVITVLFTDIAGSTAMTQALGDAGAQEVVRAHNRVVREALTQFRGREVKHTGDGIMASFEQASDSVEAAIMMQRGANEHTQGNPNLPLYLKIGINAGEPIQEDNDLFGSTVQMSARVVDKAQKNEIFVTDVVKGICSGKSYRFVNRGGFEMKGFDGPVTLWEVDWRRAQAAE